MNTRSLKGLILFIPLFVCASVMCWAQDGKYFFDQEVSRIAFEIKHLGVLTVEGRFEKFEGSINFVDDVPESLVCSIHVNSMNTDDNSRDKTLLSDEYLGAESFPFITFNSEEIHFNDKGLMATGELRIRNVAKKIRLQFDGAFKNGKHILMLKAWTELKRSTFKFDFGTMEALVGDEIFVKLELSCLGD